MDRDATRGSAAVRTVWYRSVVCWKRQRSGFLVLIVLIGLVGGIALGSVAAARRTASSFTTFLAATNPSDLMIVPAGGGPGPGPPHLAQRLEAAVRAYPQVKHVESYEALSASLVKSGKVGAHRLDGNVLLVSSVDGLLFDQDRLTVTSGRMADPTRADEVMVTQSAATTLGLHLGQTLTVAVDMGSGSRRRIGLKVVGIGLLNREVVQDQIARFPTYIVGTPALARSVGSDSNTLVYLGAQLRGGAGGVAAVERRWNSTERYFTDFEVTSQVQSEAQQAIRPEALALGAFGAIAALAALFLGIQVIARQSGRARTRPRRHARCRGRPGDHVARRASRHRRIHPARSRPGRRRGSGPLPLFPIGPVRAVYPDRGVNADWTVLGAGFALLVGLLGLGHSCSRSSEHRTASSGAPAPASAARPHAAGGAVRAAAVRRRGHDVRRRRTFGQGVRSLPWRPSRRGRRHDRRDDDADLRREPAHVGVRAAPLRMELGLRGADAPTGTGRCRTRRWRRSETIARSTSSSGIWFATMQLDGVEVPTLLSNPGSPVAPPIISGHASDLFASDRPRRSDARTVAQAHRRHRGPQVRAGLSAPPHPVDDRRRGHHAGDRDRRGAPHVNGDRCGRARRRRPGHRESGSAGLRRTL